MNNSLDQALSPKAIFLNAASLATFALVACQQACIAAAAWCLTRTIAQVQAGEPFLAPLGFYLLAMIIPYLPGCLSFVTLQHWINRTHLQITDAMVDAVKGRAGQFSNSEAKAAFDSALSRNAFHAVAQYLGLSHDFAALALNSLLSAIVLGVLLPIELAAGYAISLLASVGVILAIAPRIRHMSLETERQFARYGHQLGSAWGNVTLNNRYNMGHWQRQRQQAGTAYYQANVRLAAIQQGANTGIALIALLPTAYLVYHLLAGPGLDAALAAAVVVNLTRIFHILGALSTVVYQLLAWQAARARLRFLDVQTKDLGAESLNRPLSGALSVNGEPPSGACAILERINASERGRFTLRGPNGAGKSTLLLALKDHWRDEAWLVPAQLHVLSWASASTPGSTGQQALAMLSEVVNAPHIPRVVLLDEWDANLDAAHRQCIDGWLDALSKQRVVVEVRHG
ncbi:hypothetical protein [Pseudomonas sp. NPDC007930]|uniref:hypothetical protein n=1 Tax=Pseudomonas sp. NPDC007930 TaxID=3364417 RepID=UPI0036E0C971